MSDKITLEFDRNQLVTGLISNGKGATSDAFLEKYVEARLKIDELTREKDAIETKNKLLIKTISELNKNYNKVLDKNEKCRNQLELKRIESKLYLAFSKVLFTFTERFMQTHKFDYNTTCSICLNNLTNQNMEYICMTQCQHYFHETCLDKYFMSDGDNDKCPNCRNEIYDLRLGHFEKNNDVNNDVNNVKFVNNNLKFKEFLKHFLENSPMIDIKNLEDHDDALRIFDYDNFIQNQDTYQNEPDVLVNDGNLILGSIISQFVDNDANNNDANDDEDNDEDNVEDNVDGNNVDDNVDGNSVDDNVIEMATRIILETDIE
jgi:hypothetical protein